MRRKINCVMLIDDNEDDNFFHELILKGAEVAQKIEIAESGFEALDYLAKNEAPGLIFLDINMPKMNGWEFLEQYKKLNVSEKAKVIIIMLTTSLNPEDKKKATTIPQITGFETKPITHEMIRRITEKYFSFQK